MPDQVPVRVAQIAQGVGLPRKLLHSIFAEDANAGGVGFTNKFGRKGLADYHQCNFCGTAADSERGCRDSFADARNIVFDGHCRDLTTEGTEEGKSKKLKCRSKTRIIPILLLQSNL